jgi:hypothetical protein
MVLWLLPTFSHKVGSIPKLFTIKRITTYFMKYFNLPLRKIILAKGRQKSSIINQKKCKKHVFPIRLAQLIKALGGEK